MSGTAIDKNLKIACEKCDHAVECGIMNPDHCHSGYAPALNTNFDMTKEYTAENIPPATIDQL